MELEEFFEALAKSPRKWSVSNTGHIYIQSSFLDFSNAASEIWTSPIGYVAKRTTCYMDELFARGLKLSDSDSVMLRFGTTMVHPDKAYKEIRRRLLEACGIL